MIKAIFSFFQMQVERMFGYAIKLGQPTFCIAPERLNTVNMPFTIRKFILAMIHSKVLIKANINQAVVASPAIRVNDSRRFYMTSDNVLQRSFRAIWHNLGINFTLPFQQSKYNRFTISTTPTFTSNATRSKIRFINFNSVFKGCSNFASFCHTLTNFKVNTIYRSNGNSDQFSRTHSSKIEGKAPYKLPKFSLADSRTAIISIFINHLSKLPHFKMCLTS